MKKFTTLTDANGNALGMHLVKAKAKNPSPYKRKEQSVTDTVGSTGRNERGQFIKKPKA